MSEIESTIRIGVWNALRSCGVGQDACYPIVNAAVKELLPKLDQSERVSRLEEALKAIDQTAFIGCTTDSDEARRVALDSVHDIARSALNQGADDGQ